MIRKIAAKKQLKTDMETAWSFFSDPKNLAKITPQELGFKITSETPESIYAGLFIEYTVTPLFGIPVTWLTEITHCRKSSEQSYFVDEQRTGPYAIWHHEHRFTENEHGVLIEDTIHYKLPLSPLSEIIHPFVIKPKLDQTFQYRDKVIEDFL